jgi:hypothetical protein
MRDQGTRRFLCALGVASASWGIRESHRLPMLPTKQIRQKNTETPRKIDDKTSKKQAGNGSFRLETAYRRKSSSCRISVIYCDMSSPVCSCIVKIQVVINFSLECPYFMLCFVHDAEQSSRIHAHPDQPIRLSMTLISWLLGGSLGPLGSRAVAYTRTLSVFMYMHMLMCMGAEAKYSLLKIESIYVYLGSWSVYVNVNVCLCPYFLLPF